VSSMRHVSLHSKVPMTPELYFPSMRHEFHSEGWRGGGFRGPCPRDFVTESYFLIKLICKCESADINHFAIKAFCTLRNN
jgi:hypothetical protein